MSGGPDSVAVLTGRCLCGAVTVEVTAHEPSVSACHCDNCRRWSGAAQWGFEAPAEAVTVTGQVATFRATAFSERGFCPVCGTHLWIRDDGGPYDLLPGTFDGARDMPLSHEVYADRAFASVRLAGGHERVGKAAYERAHPHVSTGGGE